MRPKLLLAASVVAVGALVGFSPSRPPPAVQLTTTATPTTVSSGPSSDSRAELTKALKAAAQNDAVARWYAAAAAKQQQAADEAATKVVAAPRPARGPSRTGPAPAPTDPVGSGDAETAVRQYFGDIFDQAWGVSGCESGHDPGAISPGGGNWGLFQINAAHRADFEQYTGQPWSTGVLNAFYNAMYARKLYDGSGWGPWSCKWAAR